MGEWNERKKGTLEKIIKEQTGKPCPDK